MERGETSNSKSKREREDNWENYENETVNRRGYTRANGKWTKISDEFKPHYEEGKSKKLLNLDCVRNPEEILERWSNNMIMLLATDERFSKVNLMDVKNLIAYRTTGNVLKNLTSIEDETWQQYARMTENNQQFAKLIIELIYKDFIGFNILEHKAKVNKQLTERAKAHLHNMQCVRNR
ncbi:capsid protein [Medicago truncatula]|uniref:Capsid protein n=1 Tax=Medicago truncatula TaxID=3880 RepID=G7KMH5_MEDTR|nr:capsid protein [Medicago truncatula]